eukprot:349801-Chlamydomonas_euryale.AAC.56
MPAAAAAPSSRANSPPRGSASRPPPPSQASERQKRRRRGRAVAQAPRPRHPRRCPRSPSRGMQRTRRRRAPARALRVNRAALRAAATTLAGAQAPDQRPSQGACGWRTARRLRGLRVPLLVAAPSGWPPGAAAAPPSPPPRHVPHGHAARKQICAASPGPRAAMPALGSEMPALYSETSAPDPVPAMLALRFGTSARQPETSALCAETSSLRVGIPGVCSAMSGRRHVMQVAPHGPPALLPAAPAVCCVMPDLHSETSAACRATATAHTSASQLPAPRPAPRPSCAHTTSAHADKDRMA